MAKVQIHYSVSRGKNVVMLYPKAGVPVVQLDCSMCSACVICDGSQGNALPSPITFLLAWSPQPSYFSGVTHYGPLTWSSTFSLNTGSCSYSTSACFAAVDGSGVPDGTSFSYSVILFPTKLPAGAPTHPGCWNWNVQVAWAWSPSGDCSVAGYAASGLGIHLTGAYLCDPQGYVASNTMNPPDSQTWTVTTS